MFESVQRFFFSSFLMVDVPRSKTDSRTTMFRIRFKLLLLNLDKKYIKCSGWPQAMMCP